MDGGGTSELFVLGDIGNYKNVDDFAPIVSASLIGMNFAVTLSRFGSLGGFSMNAYFDTFGLEGILANTSFLVIMFQLTRWAYTTFYTSGERPWSPFVFVCILISMEFLHDLIFYYGPLKSIPAGKNDMIDALKRYAAENGSRALAGHAAFLIFVAVIAMFLKESTFIFTFIVISVTLYMLPFMITTLGPRPPPPPPPPSQQEKKEGFRWTVPRG
jgi:hypothetical protein